MQFSGHTKNGMGVSVGIGGRLEAIPASVTHSVFKICIGYFESSPAEKKKHRLEMGINTVKDLLESIATKLCRTSVLFLE